MTQTDANTVHTEPTARRPPGPWVWTLSGVLLTVAGLAAGAGAILRWGPCFFSGFDSEACGWLQGDQSGPWSEDVLSPVLTTSAALIGIGYVFVGLAFVVLPLVTRWAWSLGALATLPALWSIVEGSAIITRSVTGSTTPWDDTPGLVALGMLGSVSLVVLALVALLARASRRVAVLAMGLLVGSVVGVVVDWLAWSAVYASFDDPPGSGLVSATVMLIAGIALLITRRRPWVEPAPLRRGASELTPLQRTPIGTVTARESGS